MQIHGRRRNPLASALLLAAAVGTGCATLGPSGSAPAAAAPAAGWISGENAKQSLRRAAAGSGTLTSASVGYYMDVAEAQLREQLDGSGVAITRSGDELTLSVPGDVAFAAASAELSTASGGVFDRVAAVLKKYDKTVIEVAGHSDSSGGREDNQALSGRRAAAVAAYLEKRGVPKSRVVSVGAGDTRPVASNASAAGRARNRRIEVTLAPLVRSAG
jgi:outer membrane protein OmpA-like peptidoglycan-associated protein